MAPDAKATPEQIVARLTAKQRREVLLRMATIVQDQLSLQQHFESRQMYGSVCFSQSDAYNHLAGFLVQLMPDLTPPEIPQPAPAQSAPAKRAAKKQAQKKSAKAIPVNTGAMLPSPS